MKESDRLLLNNKSWAQERRTLDPEFFERSALDQKPSVLWIGCSDSRVPANTVTATDAGDIFVHRNIANVVVATDLNFLSVLQYAVDVLQVKHVVVCGHYGCGGVKAAMARKYVGGPLSHWLRAIRQTYRAHYEEIEALPEAQRFDRLCELNVQAQVNSLLDSSIIQAAWNRGQETWLHGWVYGMSDGLLRELSAVEPGTPVHPAFKLDF
jgi:carbonic anhydrase